MVNLLRGKLQDNVIVGLELLNTVANGDGEGGDGEDILPNDSSVGY